MLPVFIGVAAHNSSHGCERFQQVHIDSDLRPLDEFPLRSHLQDQGKVRLHHVNGKAVAPTCDRTVVRRVADQLQAQYSST